MLTGNRLLVVVMEHIGVLLLPSSYEPPSSVGERLLRHAHVALSQFERLNKELGSSLEILQRNARSVLSGNGNALEMRHEVMFVNRNGIVRIHFGRQGVAVDLHYSAREKTPKCIS